MVKGPLIAVTGSDRPYVFDLPQVLSLPPGFEFRFRYRADWIDPEVLLELSRTKGGLANRELWLYFHSRKTQRLLPLRRCSVVRLEQLGPVYFLRFRVEEFPNWARFPRPPSLPNGSKHERATCPRCQQSDAASAAARELVLGEQRNRSLELELPKGSYLRFGANDGAAFCWHTTQDSPEKPLKVSEHWGESIDIFAHEEPELLGVPLFYLLGFQGADDAWLNSGPLHGEGSALATHGYELVQGQRYRMRVIEWRQDQPEQQLVKISCEFDPEVLRLEGAWSMVVGKYDVPEFTFNALKRGYGEVAIATERLPAVGTGPVSTPTAPASLTAAGSSTAPADERPSDLEASRAPATLITDVAQNGIAQPAGVAGSHPAQVTLRDPGTAISTRGTEAPKRAEWPSYYSARVPVKVKFGWQNAMKFGALSVTGLFAFALPQTGICEFVSSGVPRSGVELLGLFLLMLAGGKYSKDYASFSSSVYRLPGVGGHPGSPG